MLDTLRRAMLAAVLFTAGCNTPTSPPPKDYIPEAGLTTATAASLSGSKVENPNFLSGDLRVYITHIDNARTQLAGDYPDQDTVILVKPGTHYVRIILTRKDFWRSLRFSACSEQFVELEAGKTYVARGELKGRESTLWLDEVGTAKEQARATAGVSTTQHLSTGYSSMQIIRSRPCAQ